jgi:MMPL family
VPPTTRRDWTTTVAPGMALAFDYTLLILSRYRDELAEGQTRDAALLLFPPFFRNRLRGGCGGRVHGGGDRRYARPSCCWVIRSNRWTCAD